jgi:hypothetical protein
MIPRRTVLFGAAPLALVLLPTRAFPGDREEARIHRRVRGLHAEHTRRSARLVDGLRRTSGEHLDEGTLVELAEGLSWAGIAATLAREPAERLVHPAFQEVLHTATSAIGQLMETLEELLGADGLASMEPGAFSRAFDALAQGLDVHDEDPVAITLLHDATGRTRAALERRGPQAVLAEERRRIERVRRVAAHVATGDSGLLTSEDPALQAAVARGAERWGTPPGRPPLSANGMTAGQTVGVLALGLVVVGGVVVFAWGVSIGSCLCASVPVALLGLVIVGLASWGIVRLARHGAIPCVALLRGPGWVAATVADLTSGSVRLTARGHLFHRGEACWFGPAGHPRILAGPGAPWPALPLGAVLARLPDEGAGTLVAPHLDIRLPADNRLELALNLPSNAEILYEMRVLARPTP